MNTVTTQIAIHSIDFSPFTLSKTKPLFLKLTGARERRARERERERESERERDPFDRHPFKRERERDIPLRSFP